MAAIQKLLAAAVTSAMRKKEECAVATLFTPGGTHAGKGEFTGMNDFEAVAYLSDPSGNQSGETTGMSKIYH